jgi:hypothetical protein
MDVENRAQFHRDREIQCVEMAQKASNEHIRRLHLELAGRHALAAAIEMHRSKFPGVFHPSRFATASTVSRYADSPIEESAMDEDYRIDWSRPVGPWLPGERIYHATSGIHHILVVATHKQLLAAQRVAEVMRNVDPEASVQQVIEETIRLALEERPLVGGELRLRDEDFR